MSHRVHDANGQRPTANGQRPSVAMAISMYVSVRTHAHAHAHAPSQSTSTTHHDSCQKHMSRIDADDAAAPPSCSHSATTHRLAMLRPPHITCLKPPFASLPERVSVTLTLTCCVELVSLLTLSLSFATLGVHPRIRPAWRPAARDLIRLAPGLRGCCGSVPPSRHIASTTPTANGQRPTANGQRPSVAMATSMYVSVRTHAHAHTHAPPQSTSTTHHDSFQKHTSRIDADEAPAPPSVMLTLRNHASSRHAPATSHHVPQAP